VPRVPRTATRDYAGGQKRCHTPWVECPS
jgi:hypothetical protein